MKRSMWLFIKSKCTRILSFLNLPTFCFLIAIVVGVSCRFHNSANDSNTSEIAQDSSSWSRFNPFNLLSSPPKQQAIYTLKNNIPIRLLALTTNLCIPNKDDRIEKQQWTLPVTSAFGMEKVKIIFSPESLAATQIEVAGEKFTIDLTTPIASQTVASICEASSSEKGQLSSELSKEINQITTAWLSQIVPDCRATVDDYGLFCHLPEANKVGDTEKHLRSIRKTMIRRWSRQPYILTRRVSVAIELAEALGSNRTESELDHLCKMIRSSKPNELPLALSTSAWQEAVCSNQLVNNRTAAASIGLLKATSEIEFFKKLYEHSSKLGLLTIKIPRDQTPSKDLLVTLIPSEKVKSNLLAELSPSQHQCWHPLFGVQSQALSVANYLNITSSTEGRSCNQPELDSRFAKNNKQYLSDSITSETEFVITNGRSKILRLPNGEYTYKIQPHSNKIGDEPAPTVSSQGSIVWKNRRPQATIRKW